MERPDLEESLLQAFNSTELESLPPYKKRDIAHVVELILKRDRQIASTKTAELEQTLERLTSRLQEMKSDALDELREDGGSTGVKARAQQQFAITQELLAITDPNSIGAEQK